MKESMVNNHTYLFEAWTDNLSENPIKFVLSDTQGNNLSRKDADVMSGRVYAWLKNKGIGKDDFVLVNLDRGVKPVIAIMGVLKNGSAFSIVESDYPAERIAFIKNDCDAKIEINEDNWAEIMSTESLEGYVKADDHDACLAVYTSGTTGTPKGVLHEYGQLKLEMLSEQNDDGTWRENPDTNWALVASFNFIASIKIVIHSLYCGVHLHIIDPDTVKNSRKLEAYFIKNKINGTFLSPSLIRLKGPEYGPFMKLLYTGAESANNIYANNATLINTYSMSESFFTITEYIIEKALHICPIGNPRFDLDIRLVDGNGNDVQEGKRGELIFENPFCRGYINNPEETELHFKDGYFYTGDLAVFKDGKYYLKGRKDDMVKIDGNRIEPSEIEAACHKLLGIDNCVAKGFADKASVVVYYTGNEEIDTEEAIDKLNEVLPYYMIPSFFVKLDAIPLNKSFKVDRKALLFPSTLLREPYIAPRDDFEKKLLAVFEKVLGVNKIGIDDDFYKLGGNSIKSIDAVSRMDDEKFVSSLIYKGRTVREISVLYKSIDFDVLNDAEKEEIGRKQRYPLGPIETWLWTCVNDGSFDFVGGVELNALIPMGKVENIINEYIKTNSTFNLRIENDNGNFVNVYSPETYVVKTENVSKAEADNIIKNFIGPFECGKPVIRIRLLKSGIHKYLLIQIAHIVTDGAGVHLMIEDIKKLVQGKDIKPARYFAFLYDKNNCAVEPAMYQEARQYYLDTIQYTTRNCGLTNDNNTDSTGYGRTDVKRFDLGKIREVLPRYNGSISTFVNIITLYAQNNYNNQPSYVETIYENRSPGENIAGMKLFTAGIGFTRDNESVADAFEDINCQVANVNKYTFFNLDGTNENIGTTLSFQISYVADWFDGIQEKSPLGKPIQLENQHLSESQNSAFILTVKHEKNDLVCLLEYDKKFLSDSNAERFMKMLEYAGNSVLDGQIPDFDNVEF